MRFLLGRKNRSKIKVGFGSGAGGYKINVLTNHLVPEFGMGSK